MKFFFFHLMPYPRLPDDYDERYASSFIVLQNTYYDPVYGHDLYNRYLDEGNARGGPPPSVEQMNEEGLILIGSAETVRQRLAEAQSEYGLGLLVGTFQFGSLPHDLTRRSTELFAEKVMPAFRPAPAVV